MRLIKLTLILAIGLITAPAFGGGLSKEEALLEFSFECAQCAAYFGLISGRHVRQGHRSPFCNGPGFHQQRHR